MNKELARKFIGGRGYGTKLLYDEGVAAADPLGPENKLLFINGPLTGASVPTGGRYMVVTKSPLTGMIACSNSGGEWGARLKYAGYDAIIVEGKAEKPVRVNIVDDKVELLPADEYWGMKTEETEAALQKAHPGCSVLNIGPAGEKMALLACVMNEGDRAAGRSGVGAVMGSKNLKAITVTASRSSLEAHDGETLKETAKECNRLIRENGVAGAGLPTYGTAVLVNIVNSIGSLPKKNWQLSQDEDAEMISGETLREKFLVKQGFCHRCPIGCGRVVKLFGEEKGGPEYEVLWAYGSDCGVNDLEKINEANYWCNEYGMDAISVPCTIAAAMELYQRGHITEAECEGMPLTWGNADAIVEWTKRMGKGETALGRLMANGSWRLCEHYGHTEYSMSVKKQEIPAYDARGIQGIGITYATSNRGACHVRGYTIAPEVAGLPEQLDRLATEGKATWAKIFQDLTAVIDSCGMCLFTSFALGAPQYTALLNAATGAGYSVEEVMEAGERIYNIERLFNKAAGMKPEDDRLPKRLTDEPIAEGPSKGEYSKIALTLPEYYQVRGWENAFPTAETIKRLGLDG
jgi:aldehyde:ferredoxin oxidoreductase